MDLFKELENMDMVEIVDTKQSIYGIECRELLEECKLIKETHGHCNHINVDIFIAESARIVFWEDPVEQLVDMVKFYNSLKDRKIGWNRIDRNRRKSKVEFN